MALAIKLPLANALYIRCPAYIEAPPDPTSVKSGGLAKAETETPLVN